MKANELSAKDLMIGDWVSYHGIVNKVAPADFCQKEWIDEIKPIPLTPEILEKNGFKKCAGNEWSVFKYEDDDYTKKALYQVLWSSDELYLEIASYTSRTGEFNRLGVEFVHELQHALRLCGITREIIL